MQDCSNCELRDYCIPDECTKEKKTAGSVADCPAAE
nr:MAG TPA: hypothetical protein [Caudoviricetes sp.]